MTSGGRRILGFWVGAVVLGGLLSAAIQLALVPLLDSQIYRFATSPNAVNWYLVTVRFAILVPSAVAIAGPPAFVLGRRLVGIELPWIVASVVAALVAAGIPLNSWLEGSTGYLIAAPQRPSLVVIPLLFGLMGGGVTGVAQGIVLRPYVHGAAWWIPAVIGARAVANVATAIVNWQISGAAIGLTTPTDFYAEALVGGLVGWLIVGLATGLVLVRLLGEPNPERTPAVT